MRIGQLPPKSVSESSLSSNTSVDEDLTNDLEIEADEDFTDAAETDDDGLAEPSTEIESRESTNRSYSIAGFIEKLRRREIPDAAEIGWLIQNKQALTVHNRNEILAFITDKRFSNAVFVHSMGLVTDFLVISRNQTKWLGWAKNNTSHAFSQGLLSSSEFKDLLPKKKKKQVETPFRDSINDEART